MRSDLFSLDVRRFDQRGPFLDLALNKFLEIFGRPAIGRNQNGAELLQAPERRNYSAPPVRERHPLIAGITSRLQAPPAGEKMCLSARSPSRVLVFAPTIRSREPCGRTRDGVNFSAHCWVPSRSDHDNR